MLKDLDDKDFDDKGLSYLVSYQYWKGPFGVELAGELLPKRLDETALAPQAYLLFGDTLYLVNFAALISPANTTIAVPCWSS